MSLSIITGAMGCGKTGSIFEELIASALREPFRRHIVIAPEQATLQIEKRLIGLHPEKVLFNIDVMSFNRLATRIFDECGEPVPVIIDEVGKIMLLRRCIQECEDSLTVYAGTCHRPGFIKKLKVMLSELVNYGVSPQDLRDAAEDIDDRYLKSKLDDLSLLADSFNAARDGMHITSEELLPRALTLLGGCRIFDGAYVVLEGFSGFTPVQYEYLEHIVSKSGDCIISLTLPGDEELTRNPAESELFYPAKNTYNRITSICERAGVKHRLIRYDDRPAVPKAETLVYLEQNVLRPGKRQNKYVDTDALRIVSCLNPSQELEMVTHEIKRLVREADGALRYRDIAVVTDAISDNVYLIRDAFNKAMIPYYIDAKTDILANPFTVFTLSALEAVKKSFSYETVFRFLRSGFSDASAEELDELENYVLGTGIRSIGRWRVPFVKTSYRNHRDVDLDHLNEIREKAIMPLIRFKDSYGAARLVKSRIEALRGLYADMRAEDKLSAMSEAFAADGRQVKASEYRQVFSCMDHILDEYDRLLGDQQISRDDFGEVLLSGLSEKRIGALPATLDEVQIGDVRRSRRGYVKVMFFINMNDGIVPASLPGGGLLGDGDREALSRTRRGPELAPSALQNVFDERFHIYELLSSPTEHLILSYSRLDKSNKPAKQSSVISEIRSLFESLREIVYHQSDISGVESTYEALHYLAGELKDGRNTSDPVILQLVSSLKEAGFAHIIDLILSAHCFDYRGQKLSGDSVRSLYGDVLYGSVSSLEKFSQCPFSYFAQYGLKLRDRASNTFDPIDRGNYFHTLLEHVFSALAGDREQDLEKLTEEGIALAEEKVSASDHTDPETGSSRERYKLSRWREIASKVVRIMKDIQDQSGFETEGVEYEFHDRVRRLDNGGSLRMNGKIDRYDVSELADGRLVRVVDYKSSEKKPDADLIISGISMQLIEYLSVALERERHLHPETKPEGVYYLNTKDELIQANLGQEDEAAESVSKEYIPKGLTSSDVDLDAMMAVTEENIKNCAAQILDGEISVRPYRDTKIDSCKYCTYKDVCGFDSRLRGFVFRRTAGDQKAKKENDDE
ncbi:MAG: exodeoxyribonuclease V subunit gamma [Lachnospiraceae bacterium]|nr:exodeoxyribonuclease V subunit gamma [Lachnospiraceae bacterium]